jgi:hypothetical protein
MAGHRVLIAGAEAIDADAVAPMAAAGTMEITALTQVQPHMAAALGAAKEDQIARAQQAETTGPHRHGLAEPFLLVSIPGDPDA